MLIVCVLSFLVGLMGVLNAPTAFAQSVHSSLALRKGASIRYVENPEERGIRYGLTISKANYEAIKEIDANAEFGVLIAPLEYHETAPLNEANVFGIDGTAVYNWAERDENGNWVAPEIDPNKKEIIKLGSKNLGYNEEDETYNFYGSIVNIKAQNKDRIFVGVAYVLYTEGGTQKAATVTDESNQRSMAYVAQLAIEDLNAELVKYPEDEEEINQTITDLETAYVNGITSSATVNHYQLQKDGTYKIAESSKTDAIQIGGKVSAEAKNYDGYVLNKSNAEDTLYANGKTELNFYYHKENLGLVDKNTVASFDYQTAFPNARYYDLKKVVWDDELHANQIEIPEGYAISDAEKEKVKEYKVSMTVEDYITDGKLDLTKLDGVYEIQAVYGTGESRVVVTTKFDVYDATETEIVWNNASTALDYARSYMNAGDAKDWGGQKEVVALTDEGHTGDYIKLDYISSSGKTYPKLGGFSVLALHSYEYYEQALNNNPTYALSFNFKVKGVSKDGQTIVGLHGNSKNPGAVYVTASSETNVSSADKHPAGEIQPDVWYNAEIPLSSLLRNWDNLTNQSSDGWRNPNAGSNWGKMIFWDTQSLDSQGNAFEYGNGTTGANFQSFDIWVGDFEVKSSIDFNNLFSKSENYHFQQLHRYELAPSDSAYTFNRYLCVDGLNSITMPAVYSGESYTDANGVTNIKNFTFARPAVAQNQPTLFAFKAPEFLTKSFLEQLKGLGYNKLTYSYVLLEGCETKIAYSSNINFDYLKENTDKTMFNDKGAADPNNQINTYYQENKSLNLGALDKLSPGVSANCWVKVEYSLDDLIACYDQIFCGEYFVLGLPYVGGKNLSGNIHISPVEIVK